MTDRYKLGHIPDPPDDRDHKIQFLIKNKNNTNLKLPTQVNLQITNRNFPLNKNQGNLGACTAFATCTAFEHAQSILTNRRTPMSTLFLYWLVRKAINTISYDSGGYLRDAMKALTSNGVSIESCWPYVISKFRLTPPQSCFNNGLLNQCLSYQRLDRNIDQIKAALANNMCVIFGMLWINKLFYIGRDGIAPPCDWENDKKNIAGGHALAIFGYDDNQKVFLVMNSWGLGWGNRGTFQLPYCYFETSNYVSDLWTIMSVETPPTKISYKIIKGNDAGNARTHDKIS